MTGEAKAEADARATQLVTEATLNDARIRAKALDRQSREKVAALDRDAARKHTEIRASISQEKILPEI